MRERTKNGQPPAEQVLGAGFDDERLRQGAYPVEQGGERNRFVVLTVHDQRVR